MCEYAPVVFPDADTQFVVGLGVIPKHVPRSEIMSGIPKDSTVAPNVAPVVLIAETVGLVRVGIEFVIKVPSREYPVPEIFLA